MPLFHRHRSWWQRFHDRFFPPAPWYRRLFHRPPKHHLKPLTFLIITSLGLLVSLQLVIYFRSIREKAAPPPPIPPSRGVIPAPATDLDRLVKPGVDRFSPDTIIEDFALLGSPPVSLPKSPQTETLTLSPTPLMDTRTTPLKVLTLIYQDKPPIVPPETLTTMLEQEVEQATVEHGYRHPQGLANIDVQLVDTITHPSAPPRKPGASWANYHQIIDDHQLCQRVNDQEIDEVWIWAAGDTGLYEGIMVGPWDQVYNTVGPPLVRSDCHKAIHLMGFNYQIYWYELPLEDRNVAPSAKWHLHGFMHRAENALALFLDGRNRYTTQPGDTWFLYDGQVGYAGSLYQQPFCGNAHWTVNATSLGDDYDYHLTTEARSNCRSWRPDQTWTETVTCHTWGCSMEYNTWWLQNMPGRCRAATMTKLDGSPMPNWWHIIFYNALTYPPDTCLSADYDLDADVDFLDLDQLLHGFPFARTLFDLNQAIAEYGSN